MDRIRLQRIATLLLLASMPAMELHAEDIDAQHVDTSKRYILAADDATSREQSEGFFVLLEALKQQGNAAADVPLHDLLQHSQLESPFVGDERFYENALAMVRRFEPFVWGGTDAGQNDFPESVVTFGASNGVCSGVLVSKDRVLTAGHCVCEDRVDWVRMGNSLQSFVSEFEVVSFELMAGNCAVDLRGQDLAILTLSGSATVTPARLADFSALNSLQSGTVVGFGRADRARPSDVKRYADIVVTSLSCLGTTTENGITVSDATRYGCIPNQDLVAGSPAWPADTCGGDSGGPFYTSGGAERRLVAITSRGIPTAEQPCGDGGVYTRLDGAARTWLLQQGIML